MGSWEIPEKIKEINAINEILIKHAKGIAESGTATQDDWIFLSEVAQLLLRLDNSVGMNRKRFFELC